MKGVIYMNPYIGCESQLYGIEEHRLTGGRGDGMRLLIVRNGKGMEMTVSLDRAADISRLSFDGCNMSYFSPCGYVSPSYYQATGSDWLKSFTAGFLTTCGLQAVGSPCEDEGEILPLHGSIANTPAEQAYWFEEKESLIIRARIQDETLFGRKLRMHREICVSLKENTFTVQDTIENTGDTKQPFEILYHMNMGYPLLDEDSILEIPAREVLPRDDHAASDIQNCLKIDKPQAGYTERCYYHRFKDKTGQASIYQPKRNKGLKIEFDAEKLDGFTQWKMMGIRDYVLGLECGNCYPDGRNIMRQTGMLKFLDPGQSITYQVKITEIKNSIIV